jgi:hypothetical protein
MPEEKHHEKKPAIGKKLALKEGVKVLLSWTAPERLWQPKDRQWYLISAICILLPVFIAVRMGAWIMIIALIAFTMLWFIQGYLQPWDVEHKVTTKGIFTHNTLYAWDQIGQFWLARKQGQLLLHIDFPKESNRVRLTLLVPNELEQTLFNELIDHVKYADEAAAGHNFISRPVYGQYLPISNFIADLDQPE